jgi:hypothetical protein
MSPRESHHPVKLYNGSILWCQDGCLITKSTEESEVFPIITKSVTHFHVYANPFIGAQISTFWTITGIADIDTLASFSVRPGPPGWLEKSDPAGCDFVRDGRSMPPALTGHATCPGLRLIYYFTLQSIYSRKQIHNNLP